MNAVNLIPLERRRGEAPSLPGVQFLGLVATLVLALAGTFVYVGVRNQISTRNSELSHVRAATTEWSAAATQYVPAITTLKQHARGFVQLGALLGERANWSLLLGQLAGVMPAHSELISLSAGAASSGSATSAGGGAATSGITIAGCAATQPVVADTMIALRRLSGVSEVSLESSTLNGAGASGGSAATGAAGAGGCALPVQFSLTLQFSPPTNLVRLLEGEQTAGATDSTKSTRAQLASTSGSTGVTQ